MELRKVTDKAEFRHLGRLYRRTFPKGERVPYWLMRRRALQGRAEFLGIHQDGTLVGMAYILQKGDLVYLFYLAIDERFRGRSHGTKALGLILERYSGKRLFLVVEDWEESCGDTDLRLRRRGFYERCGLHYLHCKESDPGGTFDLMGTSDAIEPSEYMDLMLSWTGPLFRHLAKMDIFRC